MEQKEIREHFENIIKNDKDTSAVVAATATLLKVLEKSKAKTMQELRLILHSAVEAMKSTDNSVTAIASGGELFIRFITRTNLDNPAIAFEECTKSLLQRGNIFLENVLAKRGKISKLVASSIIRDNKKLKILTHSRSRVVLEAMKEAAKNNVVHFEVFVTESGPDNSGKEMCKNLEQLGIPCTLILDSAVAYILTQIDMIMVGAECVTSSGGIINKIGTFQIAIAAKELNKPVYVLVESFKFSEILILTNNDLPNEFKYTSSTLKKDLTKEHPLVDFTPAKYIHRLITDLGILPPFGVRDELSRLYV